VLYIMLCGFPPFYDDSTAVLFKQIRKGEFSFPSPYWDGVSDEAKDLVSKMLVVDSGKRYTAQQCLDHPWIAKAGEVTSKKLHSGHRAFLLIRKLPIFDNIDPACLQQVTAMLKLVKVEQGQHVIQAGEVGDCMYFINAGTVQVFVNGNEVDRLTTGDFFGEVALTVSKQRTADVKSLGNSNAHSKTKGAAEPVELFQLMGSDFQFVMERFPILKTRLAQIGQARVRRATADDPGSGRSESTSPERTRGATTTKPSGASPEPTSAAPTRAGAGAGAGAGAAAPKKNSKACSQQ
jgi:CRP-like cAMP-binding protein